MKKRTITVLALTITVLFLTQTTNAQFSGTNPATLNGSARLSGSMVIGSVSATANRKLNINKTVPIAPINPTFANKTTGLRINHNQQYEPSGVTPSSINHKWELACDDNYMHFRYENTSTNLLYLSKDNKFGVATVPDATFHVKNINGTDVDAHLEGFTLIDGDQASLLLGRQTGASRGEWGIEYHEGAGGLNFWKPFGATVNGATNWHMFIKNNGKVSIGLDPTQSATFNGDYKLYVADGIMTEKVRVALRSSSDWADYVFDAEYDLMPLNDVKKYISDNKHLPDVPSAEEVVNDGYDVTSMDAKLLQKIEELTLYMITLEEDNAQLKARLEKIEKGIK